MIKLIRLHSPPYCKTYFTGRSKATVTNNISLRSLKIAKNGLTQWFLESFYAAVLVFWCLIMIRWNKSFISLFCQNGGLASARLNPACWTEPSNNPQRLPSSFNIAKYHQNTPRLSLRHPKTASDTIGTTAYLQKRSRLFIWCISISYMMSWMKVEPSYHFSTPVKRNIFFRLMILRHQNTKTAA